MSQEKLRVLEMLNEGKITADQAAALLRALGGESDQQQQRPPRQAPSPGEVRESSDIRNTIEEVTTDVREALKEAFDEVGGALREAGDEVREAVHEANIDGKGWASFFTDMLSGWNFLGNQPQYTFSEEDTIDVSPDAKNIKLQVVTKNGFIKLSPAVGESVEVKILKKLQAENKEKAEELAKECYTRETTQTEDTLFIRYVVKEELQGAVSFQFSLPARLYALLNLDTKNGAIHTEGLHAEGEVQSKNGRLTLEGGRYRNLKAITKNGSVNIQAATGNIFAETKNGSLKCCISPEADSTIELVSKNGSLRVEVANKEELGIALSASTTNGRVSSDLCDLDYEVQERKELVAKSSGFETAPIKVDIKATTKNGSVAVS